LVLIHGGPGLTHDYLDAYLQLGDSGRAIVQYDQIGNGRSSHFSQVTGDAPSVNFYVGELVLLLRHLGIENRYALLGHSCGAAIATELAVRGTTGLKALVIANGFASADLFRESLRRRRNELPLPIASQLDEHELQDTTDSSAYQTATGEFIQRFVCRVPFPPELVRSHMAMLGNPLVFQSMYGPSLFRNTGRLRDWSITDRLHLVNAPTLVVRGAFDEADESCSQPFVERMPRATTLLLEEASHMPHIEQPRECIAKVGAFLDATQDGER